MTDKGNGEVAELKAQVAALTGSLERIGGQLQSVHTLTSDGRADHREIQIKLEGAIDSIEKLSRVVIEGNGEPALRETVRTLQRELTAKEGRLVALERAVEAQEKRRSDNATKVRVAVIAAAGTIMASLAAAVAALLK